MARKRRGENQKNVLYVPYDCAFEGHVVFVSGNKF